MASQRPINMLVLASYFKGERFMRQAHARGAKLYLLPTEKLLKKPWPRECLVDVFAQREESPLQHTINTVSYLARTIQFDRIVPMDDFDVETAAALREHLRIPGMGDTTARHFRDKLACRVKAKEEGIPSPEFVRVLNYDEIREFIARVPPPWMFKPRSEASATGIHKVESEEQLWQLIESKGDRQSYYLLEKYLPGDVYHCDSVVSEKKVVFTAVNRCGKPPFNVAHGGGIFTSATVERGSPDDLALRKLNEQVLSKLNLVRGVSHVEFIKGRDDGKFYLLETAARVGGAHIAEMVEGATGVNLWAEWANIEVDRNERPYQLPKVRDDYGGLLITLAKQQKPDLSGYADPEVYYRAEEEFHAGLVVRSPSYRRVQELLETYQRRFMDDFHTVLPAADKPAH
ncbi:MAG: acetyl-CoA carboxylase biotin carboxylase subunit family protein [Myxococcales bacterium]